MFKTFGNSKEVFVNQDEGMFVAFPITLDTTAYTFETESRNGRTYIKAGSVVKEGDSVKGIMAEEYDITDGPIAGRYVVEGYAWAACLTAAALAGASSLPKIVVMPYKYVSVEFVSADPVAHKLVIRTVNGGKFKSGFTSSDLTIELGSSITANYAVNAAGDELTITASGTTHAKITAITGIVGAATDFVVHGLPIEAEL